MSALDEIENKIQDLKTRIDAAKKETPPEKADTTPFVLDTGISKKIK